jgi:hypothetical protein
MHDYRRAVTYKDGSTAIISNPADFPDSVDNTSRIAAVEEPIGETLHKKHDP